MKFISAAFIFLLGSLCFYMLAMIARLFVLSLRQHYREYKTYCEIEKRRGKVR